MTGVMHIVRKDLRRLRPLLALWIIVIGAGVALSLSGSANAIESLRTDLLLQRLSELMTIVELLLGGLIIAQVVHEEPLVGLSAFWLTRPYDRGALLRAKLLFVFTVLIVLPLLGDATTMTLMGAGAPALAAAIPWLALGYLVATLAMLVIAVLTPSLGALVLTLVGIVTGVSLLTTVMSALTNYLSAAPTGYRPPGVPDFTPAIVMLVVFLCAGLSVVIYQYRRRRLGPAVVLAVAGVGATVVVPWVWPFPFVRGEETRPGPWADAAAASYDASWGTELSDATGAGRGAPRRQVSARVTLSGAPSDVTVRQIGVRGTLRLPDGPVIPSGQRGWLGSSLPTAPVEAALGGVRLLQTPEVVEQGPTPMVTLTEDEFARYRGRAGRLEADLFFELTHTHESTVLPLRAGAAVERTRWIGLNSSRGTVLPRRAGVERGTERIEILEVRRRTGSRDVIIRYWVAGVTTPQYLFALRHRGRGEALMGGVDTSGAMGRRSSAGWMALLLGAPGEMTTFGFSFGTMVVRFPRPDFGKAPALDAGWFDEAELVLLETEWGGVVSRPLTIDQFPIPAN